MYENVVPSYGPPTIDVEWGRSAMSASSRGRRARHGVERVEEVRRERLQSLDPHRRSREVLSRHQLAGHRDGAQASPARRLDAPGRVFDGDAGRRRTSEHARGGEVGIRRWLGGGVALA